MELNIYLLLFSSGYFVKKMKGYRSSKIIVNLIAHRDVIRLSFLKKKAVAMPAFTHTEFQLFKPFFHTLSIH